MREFIEVTGKTEDEAIRKALEQLGLDRDDVSVEILERAKSGFLGLGSSPAKVRVTYGPEEEEIASVVEAAPVVEQPAAQNILPWIIALIAAGAAFLIILLIAKKKKKEETAA